MFDFESVVDLPLAGLYVTQSSFGRYKIGPPNNDDTYIK